MSEASICEKGCIERIVQACSVFGTSIRMGAATAGWDYYEKPFAGVM